MSGGNLPRSRYDFTNIPGLVEDLTPFFVLVDGQVLDVINGTFDLTTTGSIVGGDFSTDASGTYFAGTVGVQGMVLDLTGLTHIPSLGDITYDIAGELTIATLSSQTINITSDGIFNITASSASDSTIDADTGDLILDGTVVGVVPNLTVNTTLQFSSGSITDTTGTIAFGNENLDIGGDIDVDGVSNLDVTHVVGTLDTTGVTSLTIGNGANAEVEIKGIGTSAPVSANRGGVIEWFSSNIATAGFLYANGDLRLVWDTAKAASNTDAGNAWIEFDTGNASFDQGNFTFIDDVAILGNATAAALVIGRGTTGVDYALTFDGETNDGILTWMEDEDYFLFADDIALADSEFLIMDKASGNGIKVDTTTPTFGFADILGDQFSKNVGATKPALAVYNGAVDAWQFGNGDEAFFSYHIPHDYAIGTDIHLHIHWSQNAAGATGGTLDFKYTAIYAKGHNQASGSTFTATPITATFSSIDINDGGAGLSQYQQHLTEVTISAATATAALFDRDDFEPDGVIELTLEMTTTNLTGTPSLPFIHFADMHYQTTSVIGTKSRTPDFYA